MINEISSKSFDNIDNKNQFNPEKRMDTNERVDKAAEFKGYNPDSRIEKNEFLSTYDERIAQAPKEGWDGKRGESLCRSLKEAVNKELAKFGLEGILYKKGVPDAGFEKCAVEKVSIEMTEKIDINMKKARTEIAKKWNEQNKDGRKDWNAREVHKYQKENGLVIHECSNRKDCYLIPEVIHKEFTHTGGRFECKKMNERLGIRKDVKFDE